MVSGILKINGSRIVLLHTVCASTAFLAALVIGYNLHFIKIVTNAHYSYPDEWWPSVSATIGDRYPERSVFQLLIAMTAFPRFCMLFIHFFLTNSYPQLFVGVLRTVTCGGWVYITSTDDHDSHDVFMIAYIVLTLPWNILCIMNSRADSKNWKKVSCIGFFSTLGPLIYWFIQHEVKIRPGAYSIYAYIEWSLIIQDILFDALSYKDFQSVNLILDSTSVSFEPLQAVSRVNEDVDLDFVPQEDEEEDTEEEEEEEEEKEHNEKTHNVKELETEVQDLIKDTASLPAGPSVIFQSDSHLLVVVFHSFLFWTSLTALMCIIWHFPLWYMGISGYEAAILFVLLSGLLYLPYVPHIMYQYGSLLISMISIGSYLADVPEKRLMTIGLGAGLACLNLAYYFQYVLRDELSVRKFSVSWLLGLSLSVILKMGNYSNNPLWPIMFEENGGWNKTGLAVCSAISIVIPTLFSLPDKREKRTDAQSSCGITRMMQIMWVSLGFGALLFATHQLLTDASTLIYWSWEGYQVGKQPMLHWPWSSVTCTVMVLSSLLYCWRLPQGKVLAIALLTGSTYVLVNPYYTSFSNYFMGGIPYIVGIMLSYPYYFQQLFQLQSTAAFVMGLFFYIVFILAHVWTVAYAFVPYGWILRERLGYVLAGSSAFIIVGILVTKNTCSSRSAKIATQFEKFTKTCFRFSVLLLAIVGIITYSHRMYKTLPEPYHGNKKVLTAGVWTIHFGLDNDMWASEQRMIDLIQDMELDVVGFMETDTQRITMGNRDLSNKMAAKLNMYSDYGPGPNKHTWGCTLLSKFPILNSTHHLLPSPVGELAPAIHATLDMYGEAVDVFVFHSGQEEDEEDRRLQSLEMARLMGSVQEGRPTFLLSYLVTDPHEGNYNTYVSETSGMHDIEPEDNDRWCEYILYKNMKKIGYARVNRGTITDTELQVGKFQILTQKELKEYGDEIYKFNKVESLHDDDLKFPDMFLEDGERGHYYHVFDTPYYYTFDLSYSDDAMEEFDLLNIGVR